MRVFLFLGFILIAGVGPFLRAEAGGVHADAQIAPVVEWLHQQAPDYPAEEAGDVANRFLDELALHHPLDAELVGSPDFPAARYTSMLLQYAGAGLRGPAFAGQREVLASRRVELALGAKAGGGAVAEAMARMKAESSAAYGRLVEGRLDDDDLQVLLREARNSAADRTATAVVATQPKTLSATDIVSEFIRRNQSGAALTKLHAYLVEADLRTPAGELQHLFLYKLRPDRFKLLVQVKGVSVAAVGFDGSRLWRQLPGREVTEVTGTEAAALRHLGEFVDPLFEGDGATFVRRDDATEAGRRCYRIAVTRRDGSGYAATIDQENYHEVARDDNEGFHSRYSDFRSLAGLTVAYQEVATGADGHERSLTITRMVPNPGLVDAFFLPAAKDELDLFVLERLVASAAIPNP